MFHRSNYLRRCHPTDNRATAYAFDFRSLPTLGMTVAVLLLATTLILEALRPQALQTEATISPSGPVLYPLPSHDCSYGLLMTLVDRRPTVLETGPHHGLLSLRPLFVELLVLTTMVAMFLLTDAIFDILMAISFARRR